MADFNFGKYYIITDGKQPGETGKTLIISTHGFATGMKFERPYATVVQFCTPNKTALRADLTEVIKGSITASEPVTTAQKTLDDYDLSWFEKDPKTDRIEAALKNTKQDVFVVKESYHVKLSEVLQFLKAMGYLYTSILCVFCRVSIEQYEPDPVTGALKYKGPSVLGGKSELVVQQTKHKIDATSVHHELQAKLQTQAKQQNSVPPPRPPRPYPPPSTS